MIQRFVLCVLLYLASASGIRASFLDISDIQYWAGDPSGANKAGFVVNWTTGSTTESLAWGYQWNGTATAEDALRAIAGAANSGLYVVGQNTALFGFAVYGLGYDLNRDGQFATNPAVNFVNGVAVSSPNDSRVSANGGDLYTEGWFSNGYWGDWTKTSSSADWQSGNGVSADVLQNGGWEGLAFDPTFSGTVTPADPVAATAVPEPGPLVLSGFGVCVMLAVWRLNNRRRLAAAT